MSQTVSIELEMPDDLGSQFRLPVGVNARLQELLDRQDQGTPLTPAERPGGRGPGGFSSELLSLLRLRAERAGRLNDRGQ